MKFNTKKKTALLLSALLLSTSLTGCLDDEDFLSEEAVASQKLGDIASNEGSGGKLGDNTQSEEHHGEKLDDGWYTGGNKLKDILSQKPEQAGYNFNENTAETDADNEVDAASTTLMVYLCGSDLESEGGCATDDIIEMIESEAYENTNIIIQTGGASMWQNDVISPDTVERYRVVDEDIVKIGDAGAVSMADENVLGNFIKFAKNEYPADRYGFIFWNHGGGTEGEYGVDENFGEKGMNIVQLANGLKKGGNHFNFIGFDCCLMGTIEIANAIAPYADYMIASEEVEPGTGWYYTNFLRSLEDDPGISMKELGKQIINDYNSDEYTPDNENTTLALIDLNKIPDVIDNLNTYMSNSCYVLENNGYNDIAYARSNAKNYYGEDTDQIDIVDYVNQLDGIDGKDELIASIEDCVLYNGACASGSNGLAMYFPYFNSENYGDVSRITDNAGMTDELYNKFFDEFVSLQTGGHIDQVENHPFSSENAPDYYEDLIESAWYDSELVSQYQEQNQYATLNTDELVITEKGDGYVLKLSDEDWDIMTAIDMQVSIDDGEGYLELGTDNNFEFDDDGDLKIEYDYNWMYLNDSLVPYYFEKNGVNMRGVEYTLGYIPAYLNGEEDIAIWIMWEEDADPRILGYTYDYDNSAAKGYYNFKNGDEIEFYFDYYDYDGNYLDQYTLEDNSSIIYDEAEGLDLYVDELGDYDVEIYFHLKDIYQNNYYTETLVYN